MYRNLSSFTRHLALSACLLFAATIVLAAESTPSVLIHAGTVLAVPGKPPLMRQTIVVRAGKVQAIVAGFLTEADLPSEQRPATVIDLSQRFVLPGLIDCHVHLLSGYGESSNGPGAAVSWSDAKVAFTAIPAAKVTLEAGFTTIRDLGSGRKYVIEAVRDAIASGKFPGPRIIAAEGFITATGSAADPATLGYRWDVRETIGLDFVCDGVDACRRVVREQVRRGADVIKIKASGGIFSNFPHSGYDQRLFLDEIRAIVETAHSLDRKVASHAMSLVALNDSLRAGVDSIEHGPFYDAESVRLFRQTGAYFVPTLVAGKSVSEEWTKDLPYPAPLVDFARTLERQMIRSTGELYRAGVKIAFGTDAGVTDHGQNAREFALLVKAGLPPAEAIRAATVNAADLLGLADKLGSLEPGKFADVIAVDSNPLQDVSTLERVRFVMKEGMVVKSP